MQGLNVIGYILIGLSAGMAHAHAKPAEMPIVQKGAAPHPVAMPTTGHPHPFPKPTKTGDGDADDRSEPAELQG